MKKSKREIREPKENEITYKVKYISGVDKRRYSTFIHARNEVEVKDLFFNEFYDKRSEIISLEECLDK